jgi:hypothetical protein
MMGDLKFTTAGDFMNLSLKDSIASFRQPKYIRTRRSNDTYQATAKYVIRRLNELCDEYTNTRNDEQTSRLIRDDIDNALRRYHQYCIKQNIGAHYIDLHCEDNGIFEHMIPNSTVRDLLLHDVITAEQACNMPTCKLSKDKDDLLRESGWASQTPDIYNFWTRYTNCFTVNGVFETYDGVQISSTMSLNDHFDMFSYLINQRSF